MSNTCFEPSAKGDFSTTTFCVLLGRKMKRAVNLKPAYIDILYFVSLKQKPTALPEGQRASTMGGHSSLKNGLELF